MKKKSLNIAITHGQIIDPTSNNLSRQDVFLRDGHIAGVGKAPEGFQPDQTINARDAIIAPGFIDLCARLREPGDEQKGTIASETRAAASSGITHVCAMPDTTPVIDTPAVATLITDKARAAGNTRVLPVGAITKGLAGEQLSEMHALKEAGCVAVTNLRKPYSSHKVMQRALEYAASHDLTVIFQPEDRALKGDGCIHDGPWSTTLGLQGITETTETVALARDLLLVQETGVKAHFGQLSCRRSVELINWAKNAGVTVSADVSAHQLHLNEDAVGGFNSLAHLSPPLRSEDDRQALREAIANGTIDAICSDHQPHETAAKLAPFAATSPGMSTIEVFFGLSKRLVDEGLLSLAQLIALLSTGPAKALKLAEPVITTGAQANLCIFSENAKYHKDANNWYSAGQNSLFIDQTYQGQVIATIVEGKVTYRAPV